MAKLHPHILSGRYIPDCTDLAVKQKNELLFILKKQVKEKQQPNLTGPVIALCSLPFLFFSILQEGSGSSGFAKADTRCSRRQAFKGCFSAFSLLPLTSRSTLQITPFFGCEAAASVTVDGGKEN